MVNDLESEEQKLSKILLKTIGYISCIIFRQTIEVTIN